MPAGDLNPRAIDELVADALQATRESRRIEFKREFSATTPGAWCELLKDIAAIANTTGGIIVIGLHDDGSPSGWDPSNFLATDMADVTNTLSKYVGEELENFEIRELTKGEARLAALVVHPQLASPLVFEKPGTYSEVEGRQKTAFAKGTVYFRHGAKSEPGSARDISRFISREVTRQRSDWLKNIRRVVAAPSDAEVVISKRNAPAVTDVRIVDDPGAPAIARTDFDVTHPLRQKDVVKAFNDRLERRVVSAYDIQCVRKVKKTDQRLDFFHKPRYSSPQYSEAFVSWLVDEYEKDPEFFRSARKAKRSS